LYINSYQYLLNFLKVLEMIKFVILKRMEGYSFSAIIMK
jgi:hypothetical protein